MGITTPAISYHDPELPNLPAQFLDSSKRKLSRCWWGSQYQRDLEISVSLRVILRTLSALILLLAD